MDYTNYEAIEQNRTSLQEVAKDVYLVIADFNLSIGQVTYPDGNKNDALYTVEKGWVILDEPETEIIDDFETRFELFPEILAVIRAALN